jgi:hypothetical protein
MVPSGMAIRIAVSVAMMATCKESWKRRATSSTIGRPVHIERPKSKVMRPLMNSQNCSRIGWSMPSSRRQALTMPGLIEPPPVASLSVQMSPGIRRIRKNTSAAAPSSVGIISVRRLKI